VVEGSARATADNWTYGVYNQFHSSYGTVPESDKLAMRRPAEHPIQYNVTTHSAQEAYTLVLRHCGASLVRDAVDNRVIEEVRNKRFTFTGSNGSANGIIDTQSDVGGWPLLQSAPAPANTAGDGIPDEWKIAHFLNPQKFQANGRDLSNVYDNVEVYINSLAIPAFTFSAK
ncbi:MAG: pectate lyase, partial [Haliscomenobacter sp.]